MIRAKILIKPEVSRKIAAEIIKSQAVRKQRDVEEILAGNKQVLLQRFACVGKSRWSGAIKQHGGGIFHSEGPEVQPIDSHQHRNGMSKQGLQPVQ
eukprot:6960584-Karenia_brevis.AAC.1